MVASDGQQWHLVTASVPLHLSLPVAAQLVITEPHRWLPGAADAYTKERDGVLASVGLGGPLAPVRRRVKMVLGPVTKTGSGVRRHLAWEAASQARFFPVMEGSLTVTPLGAGACLLQVRAHYMPPLGRAGRLADRALLHLVAAASIERFAAEVALVLEHLA